MLTPPYARLRRDLDQTQINVALNTLRQIVEAGFSVLSMADGIADDFSDETGIATGALVGFSYDAGGNFYTNAAVSEETSAGAAVASGGFDGAVFVDRSWSLNNGETVQSIGFSSNTAAADYDLYLLERVGAGSYTPRAKIAGVTHPGGLAAVYFDLAVAYVVPATGDFYVGVDTKAHASQGVTPSTVLRSVRYGAMDVGTNYTGLTEETSNTPWMGVQYAVDPASASLSSVDFDAEAQPGRGRVVALLDFANDPDPGTDFDIVMSRDDGENWSDGILQDRGVFSGTIRIVTADFDLSGQDTGTSMRWRVTSSGLVVPVHSIFAQWGV